ncbi:exodeoxyribonuclease I [Candidatus Profftella armatura (Diaphorina cf. continua)]|uniref:Exodeoxyribonuclease I n=1 Tax=Candidatus Profftella armatura (Diaphorina cf. continua) TaxID=2661583 RepID=A0A7R7ACQ2_9PROT|nr:exodeoxyribonuclease I [Candidatus Profftella armatura (Diaphorina cf. continua)]BCG49669.1 exodeoxyribonuclease I [Candidatus Profftella armatura (Diaphorina cf. continua)]
MIDGNSTFLWYDYETFGLNVRRDRPFQFAAIRTDIMLNEIDNPIMLYCKPAPDFLPNPKACLITKITPQFCLNNGIPEYKFASIIESIFLKPGTISVGYNTISFDDEVTRFMFWRNLINPYEREWKNNCSRWDLINVIRASYVLRPYGIIWPYKNNGKPSLKLEHLSFVNNLLHKKSHDALSDVRATLGLARLIRNNNPRLFNFALSLRKKKYVLMEIGWPIARPFFYISHAFSAKNDYISLMWPICIHPMNKNILITWNLLYDPKQFLLNDINKIRDYLCFKKNSLNEDIIPISMIHLNRSPIVISNLKILSSNLIFRCKFDLNCAFKNIKYASSILSRTHIWKKIFLDYKINNSNLELNIDEELYNNFISKNDNLKLAILRSMSPQELSDVNFCFENKKLKELIFRYRARNFIETLSLKELKRWEKYRISRFYNKKNNNYTINMFYLEIQSLLKKVNEYDKKILNALLMYGKNIIPKYGY